MNFFSAQERSHLSGLGLRKTNRLALEPLCINAKSCYDDMKEALMSDCKWLYMRVTNHIIYLTSIMIILSFF